MRGRSGPNVPAAAEPPPEHSPGHRPGLLLADLDVPAERLDMQCAGPAAHGQRERFAGSVAGGVARAEIAADAAAERLRADSGGCVGRQGDIQVAAHRFQPYARIRRRVAAQVDVTGHRIGTELRERTGFDVDVSGYAFHFQHAADAARADVARNRLEFGALRLAAEVDFAADTVDADLACVADDA